MKKLVVFIFVITVLSLNGQPLPEKVIVGYWHNWGYSPNIILLNEISPAFDVINVSFATPTVPSGSTMQFTPDPGIYPNVQDFIDDISFLQSIGKNVLISLGGANDPVSLITEDDVDAFVTSMSTMINTYGFDGVDIDLEGGSVSLDVGDSDFRFPTTTKIINLINALTQLTDDMPDLLLTTAPETAYVQGGYSTYGGIWGAYLPIIHALRDRWDMVHVQHYNTGSMYGADGNLYNPATADFHVAMADMLLAGFHVDHWTSNIFFEPLDAEQVAIGLPASTSAAGTGYTSPEIVHDAVDYIVLGVPFGGAYQLANPDGYEDFRGLMTWSVNWDADNDFEFSTSHRIYLDNLMGEYLEPPVNVMAEVFDDNNAMISWEPPAAGAMSYNVYQNGELIASTTEYSHTESDLDPGVYSFGVSAVYPDGESYIITADDIEVLSNLNPPQNLVVDPYTGLFGWDEPQGYDLNGYNVFLDGLAQGNTSETFWPFEDLEYDQEYNAGVQAIYENGMSDLVTAIFRYLGTDVNEDIYSAQKLSVYPNPFNPSTRIEYYLAQDEMVNISIYNVKGEKIKTLVNGLKTSGKNQVIWNGEDDNGKACASGIFLCRLIYGTESKTNKLVLLK